ncbi:MAG: TadE/TadG family type IV pilus assembly protein [Acidimicrobiales bacterium]|nr:TadE/TadG family type IV pilus assembly protein [Acidimicrobiales bacterium]
MNRLLARARRGDRGAAMVEFMFVLPAFMLLFTGAANVGLAVVSSASGTNAAREAARVATVRYECTDGHVSARCPIWPSTNYNTVKAAAIAKLGGLVPADSVTVSVVCRQGSVTGAVVFCEKAAVNPGNDVIVVDVGWSNKGATRFVPWVSKSTRVVMTIVGRPDLTALQPEPDIYPPAASACEAKDSDADGDIDKVELTFDEDIVQSVSAAAFSIANSVNGSNTISSAAVSGRVVTLNLAGTTVNTAPGSMTVSLTASASGVRDLTGNQGNFSNCVLVDKAAPKLISITDTDGLINGRMGITDTLIFTFSEPIGIGLGVTTVTETDPSGGGNDTLNIAGITSGAATTNSNNYITSNDTSQSYAAVAAAVGNTVVVTLGAPGCGLCTAVGTGSDSSAFSITVSTSLGDANGNPATGTGTISNVF